MTGQMAIAITLPGFNDFGRSVTLGSFYLPIFYLYQIKEENLSTRGLSFFFLQMPIEFLSF